MNVNCLKICIINIIYYNCTYSIVSLLTLTTGNMQDMSGVH